MSSLAIQFSVGICSGPLKSYLRSSRALANVEKDLLESIRMQGFLRRFPLKWLFVTVRYGCADHSGLRTTQTVCVPTPEWRVDTRRSEYLAFVTLDGSTWEVREADNGGRSFLSALEITRQTKVAVVCALLWVAKIHEIADGDLQELRLELGDLPGAVTP